MSEQEIRRIIRSVCAELDQRAKRAAQATARRVVLPTVMGIGLVVGGCEGEVIEPPGHGHFVDGEVVESDSAADAQQQKDSGVAEKDAGQQKDSGVTPKDSGVVALYSVPIDSGPAVKYMAPDASAKPDTGTQPDTGPTPDYAVPIDAAPVDAGTVKDTGAEKDSGVTEKDSGVVALYSVPIDSGPAVRYQAVFVDSGVHTLYGMPTPAEPGK